MSQGSGEKTEKASPKKRRDTKEKGEVHKSTDMVSAITLFLMFGTIKIGFDGFFNSMQKFTYNYFNSPIAEQAKQLSSKTARNLYQDILFQVLPIALPIMLVAMIGGSLAHVLQTGPMFTTSKLKPNFGKINPIQGFKRIFSMSTLVELLKSIIKIVIMGWIIYKDFIAAIAGLSALAYVDVRRAFFQIISSCVSMGLKIGMALVVFSAVDVLYQWWKFEKDIMMTKQEVKEESKMTEGNPEIKGKIKQLQRRMSTARMMKNLPEADVVITNPTHYAVALRYKENEDRAPVVIAKGQDFLAQRIKKVAKEHKISIVENKPVARALYSSCEIGQEIPPEMYQAIADILIYVYKTLKAK